MGLLDLVNVPLRRLQRLENLPQRGAVSCETVQSLCDGRSISIAKLASQEPLDELLHDDVEPNSEGDDGAHGPPASVKNAFRQCRLSSTLPLLAAKMAETPSVS